MILHYGLDPGSVRCALACVLGPPLDPASIRAKRWKDLDTSTALACAPVVAEIMAASRDGARAIEAARTRDRIITDEPAVRLWIEWGVLYCRPFPGEAIAKFAARSAKTSQAHADMTRLVEAVEAACADAGIETARVNVQTWRSRCGVLNPKGPDGRSLLTADRRVRDALGLLVPAVVLDATVTNPDLADALGVAIGGMLGPPPTKAGEPRKRGKRARASKATPAAVERHRVARKAKRAAERAARLPGEWKGRGRKSGSAVRCSACGRAGHYSTRRNPCELTPVTP